LAQQRQINNAAAATAAPAPNVPVASRKSRKQRRPSTIQSRTADRAVTIPPVQVDTESASETTASVTQPVIVEGPVYPPVLLHSYRTIKQNWEFENPCSRCHSILLKEEKTCICCANKPLSPDFPFLLPISDDLLDIYVKDVEHIGRFSAYYNNVLSISVTAVDQGPGGQGWEKLVGSHAVKLHGRTYHYLPKTGGSGGISYFTFDALNAAIEHGESLNGVHLQINNDYIRALYAFLKVENIYVKECQMIGMTDVHDMTININTKTSLFDVAAVTSVHTSGDRVLRYNIL